MLHQNLIAGEWMEGVAVNRDINPSNLDDVVGEYARADAAQAETAIAAAQGGVPGLVARRRRSSAPTCSTGSAPRSSPARTSSGGCSSREEGKTLPEGIGEAARAGQIFKFFAGEALRHRRREDPVGARPASRSRSRASRWAWSASSRRGTSRSRSRPGRSRRRSPTATASCSSPPTWCRAAAGRWPTSSARSGLPAGVFNLVMGRGSVVGEAHRCDSPDVDGDQLHRLGRHRPHGRGRLRRPHAPRCSSRWAARTRWSCSTTPISASRSAARVNGAFFSTGQRCTASSRLIVHRRHPRPVRRRRRPSSSQTLKVDDALKAGTDIGPVVDQNQLDQDLALRRDRPARGRAARRRRRAAQPRDAGLLPGAGAVHRHHERHAHQPRGDLRAGRERDPGRRTTTRRWRSPTTRRSACRPASAPPR